MLGDGHGLQAEIKGAVMEQSTVCRGRRSTCTSCAGGDQEKGRQWATEDRESQAMGHGCGPAGKGPWQGEDEQATGSGLDGQCMRAHKPSRPSWRIDPSERLRSSRCVVQACMNQASPSCFGLVSSSMQPWPVQAPARKCPEVACFALKCAQVCRTMTRVLKRFTGVDCPDKVPLATRLGEPLLLPAGVCMHIRQHAALLAATLMQGSSVLVVSSFCRVAKLMPMKPRGPLLLAL